MLWNFLVAILAISASILQSYSSRPAEEDLSKQMVYKWYSVNIFDEITSTLPVFINISKAQALSEHYCRDQVLPNCLYGTNNNVTLYQYIGAEPASQRIRRNF